MKRKSGGELDGGDYIVVNENTTRPLPHNKLSINIDKPSGSINLQNVHVNEENVYVQI